MDGGTRTIYPRTLNKMLSSKPLEVYTDRQTSEEGRELHGPKRCDNNKDEGIRRK